MEMMEEMTYHDSLKSTKMKSILHTAVANRYRKLGRVLHSQIGCSLWQDQLPATQIRTHGQRLRSQHQQEEWCGRVLAALEAPE